MIVFPHVPKTAGSSIRTALKIHFQKRILLDYSAAPVSDNPTREKQIDDEKILIGENSESYIEKYDIVYGHFPCNKYDVLGPRIRRAIFLRNPVDRVCSNYFYRLKNNVVGEPGDISQVSVLEFAQRNNMRNMYKNYLRGVSLSDFAFVGITERFEDSLNLFEKVFGIRLQQFKERVGNVKHYDDFLREKSSLKMVQDSQSENQIVYEEALRVFEKLMNKHT